LHFLLKLHSYDEWRYQRFEAWLENLAERGPLATVRGPLANTQKKKTWELMVNPVVDGYTKTLNFWKIIRKRQKSNSLLKIKSILKP